MTTADFRSSGIDTGPEDGSPGPTEAPGSAEAPPASAPVAREAAVESVPVRARRYRLGSLSPMVGTVLVALLGAILFGGAAFGYSATKRPAYSSESLVIVLSDSGATGDVSPITAAWVKIGDAALVLTGAAQELHVDVRELRAALKVSQPDSTPLVSIQMTTADPRRSAAWANAVSGQLLAQAALRPIPGFTLKQLTVAVPAEQPDPALGTSMVLGVTLLGALGGGVLGRRAFRRST